MHLASLANETERLFNTRANREVRRQDTCCGPRDVNARCRPDLTNAEICDGVIDILSQLTGIPQRDLRAARRLAAPVARIRQIGMYVCHVVVRMKMGDIADGFCRDRTTIIHACNVVEDLRDDPELDDFIQRIETVVAIAFLQPERNHG